MMTTKTVSFFICLLTCAVIASQAQTLSGVVNSYYQVTAINTGTNTVTLNNTTGLSPGDKILLIQMKGATIANPAGSSTYGDITALNNAGNYEFNFVCTISGNDVKLQIQLLNSYDPTGIVQLVSVPVYNSVTISDTLKSTPWDPVQKTGGIIVLEAKDTIYLNSAIYASGQGFQGGALMNYPVPPYDCSWLFNVTDYFLSVPPSPSVYYTGGKKGEGIADYIINEEYGRGKLSNGGGGGNNNNTGGGGGGNYGAGGIGGQRTMDATFDCHGYNPGVGGLSLATSGYSLANNRIFLGGGGGSGHENNGVGLPGGNGGGIIILTAKVLTGAGRSILADGVSPVNPANHDPLVAEGDGGGGGGAGGTIILNTLQVLGSINVSASGARGSDASNGVNDCTGPGGGGGAGVIWTAGSSVAPTLTTQVSGGANGVVSANSTKAACRGASNGALPGAAGLTQANYAPPINTTYLCNPLPIGDLAYFRGSLKNNGVQLTWGLYQTTKIAYYRVERSFDQLSYTPLATVKNNGNKSFSLTDPGPKEGTVYYRLVLINLDSTADYSKIVALNWPAITSLQFVGLQPNPVINTLSVNLYSQKKQPVNIVIYNSYGQLMLQQAGLVYAGYCKIDIRLDNLSSGAYFLKVQGNDFQMVKPFIKAQP